MAGSFQRVTSHWKMAARTTGVSISCPSASPGTEVMNAIGLNPTGTCTSRLRHARARTQPVRVQGFAGFRAAPQPPAQQQLSQIWQAAWTRIVACCQCMLHAVSLYLRPLQPGMLPMSCRAGDACSAASSPAGTGLSTCM